MHNGKMHMHILPVPLLVYYVNVNISLMHVEHMEFMVYRFHLNFITVKMPCGFVALV